MSGSIFPLIGRCDSSGERERWTKYQIFDRFCGTSGQNSPVFSIVSFRLRQNQTEKEHSSLRDLAGKSCRTQQHLPIDQFTTRSTTSSTQTKYYFWWSRSSSIFPCDLGKMYVFKVHIIWQCVQNCSGPMTTFVLLYSCLGLGLQREIFPPLLLEPRGREVRHQAKRPTHKSKYSLCRNLLCKWSGYCWLEYLFEDIRRVSCYRTYLLKMSGRATKSGINREVQNKVSTAFWIVIGENRTLPVIWARSSHDLQKICINVC